MSIRLRSIASRTCDPLRVTVLRTGSFAAYEARHGRRPRQMNPDRYQLDELLACAGEGR